jgi:dienelactone hydrolase
MANVTGTSREQTTSRPDARVGVLLVHGVGTAKHSDTLIDFGESILGWVARWQRAQGVEPSYGKTCLNFASIDSGDDNAIPYTTLEVPSVADPTRNDTWVVAEAWWASSARPFGFTAMLFWSVRYLGSLLFYLATSSGDRFLRLFSRSLSAHDGGSWYRLVDIITTFVHFVGYAVIGIVGYALLLPLFVLAQVPIRPLQTFLVLAVLKQFLQFNASELRVYYEDEIQAANMRRRVADAVEWLTTPFERGGGGCASVSIIAHSGGAWVAQGMLTDPAYACTASRVHKLITLGSGLNKIWEIAPSGVRRLTAPVKGDIFWVDFWGTYDPVPAGWLQPPRTGRPSVKSRIGLERDRRPWTCIYEPDAAVAAHHGLQPRRNPRPTHRTRPRVESHDEKQHAWYWPDSVRVVNRMDALTDHGGYFTNDEEVLRRVACEIQSAVYTDSLFWGLPQELLAKAIPARRTRVSILATARLLGLAGGIAAGVAWGGTVAAYLLGIGPISIIVTAALEVFRFLAGVPLVGGALAGVWLWIVAFVLWASGTTLASLVGLVPYEVFRAVWEWRDRAARDRLLRRALPFWRREQATINGKVRTVLTIGAGPPVIVLHEMPALSLQVLNFARAIARRGFRVYVPVLFGDINQPTSLLDSLVVSVRLCVSGEFQALAIGKTTPIVRALREFMCSVTRSDERVGVIGLCLTGGFALAMATESRVVAPVMAEPSLPFASQLWRSAAARKDLGLSPADLETIMHRATNEPLMVRGYRFTCDGISPAERFETLRQKLGANFIGCEIDSRPHNAWDIPRDAHSVLTVDRDPRPDHPTSQAVEQVLRFLDGRLKH